MVYFDNGTIRIRNMEPADAQIITDGEIAQGWVNATTEKYEMRLQDQREDKAVALTAEYLGHVAGYLNVYPDSKLWFKRRHKTNLR